MAVAYYGSHISEHLVKTPEGYLICYDVPINRTGTQMYTAGELGLEGEPERPVTVYRLEEDVFSPAALASLEGKDITRGHPAEMLAAENQASYSKGHLEHVRRDGGRSPAAIIAGLNHTWTDTGRQTWWAITWRLCREAGRATVLQ